jgi:hypothetical protein
MDARNSRRVHDKEKMLCAHKSVTETKIQIKMMAQSQEQKIPERVNAWCMKSGMMMITRPITTDGS